MYIIPSPTLLTQTLEGIILERFRKGRSAQRLARQ